MMSIICKLTSYDIEAPRSKQRGIFDRKDFLSVFDSLAIAVQIWTVLILWCNFCNIFKMRSCE